MSTRAALVSHATHTQYLSNRFVSYNYRPCDVGDYEALRQAHSLLLPVDYQSTFFLDVTEARAPFFSFCAVPPDAPLAGFATARILSVAQAHHNDLQCLRQLLGPMAQGDARMVYVMTLGVLPQHQRRGIAGNLLCLLAKVRTCKPRPTRCAAL